MPKTKRRLTGAGARSLRTSSGRTRPDRHVSGGTGAAGVTPSPVPVEIHPVLPVMGSLAVSSMSLDELLAVISARVREEIQAQATTPYHLAATGAVPALATAPLAMIPYQASEPRPSPPVGGAPSGQRNGPAELHQGTGEASREVSLGVMASGGIAGANSGAPARFEPPESASLQLSNGMGAGLSSHHGLGMSLSPATTPFPQRLVDRVQLGQFVKMRDLLTDNMSLLQQIDVLGGQHAVPSLPGILKPRLREVSTLPTWVYCFLAYVAMRTEDGQVRDMLAYAQLIIRESQRHGGAGWIMTGSFGRQP